MVGWKALACSIGKVLTYKNLIYLLNVQFYCINTSLPSEQLVE